MKSTAEGDIPDSITMAVAHESSKPPAFKFPLDWSDGERPQSALARGVQIRQYTDLQVNPEPIVIEDTEILLAEYLSPRRLRAITGVDDLDSVHALEVKVDTTDTSLGNFGSLLPNLRQLRLSNSCIVSLRDLGSGFDQLLVLWMSRCCLEELEGVAALGCLRELYLSYNEITDLSPCSMLDSLQILDLEGNNVDDVDQIEFLAMCSSLRNLTLEGNPICVTPRPDVYEAGYDYRAAICASLPQLNILDDEPTSQLQSTRVGANVFDADWALINELIAEGDLLDAESPSPVPVRPGTSSHRPVTGYRPGSALRPRSARRLNSRDGATAADTVQRATTAAANRPGTGRSNVGSAGSRAESATVDDSSELTLGSVVCGNPSKALRARRKLQQTMTPTTPPCDDLLNQYRKKTLSDVSTVRGASGANGDGSDDKDLLQDLLSEVHDWKKLNLQFIQDNESRREPAQILRIDDDVYCSSSDSLAGDSDSDDDTRDVERRRQYNGADAVIDDELAEAEDVFLSEMTRSKMMLTVDVDDADVDDDVKITSPSIRSPTESTALPGSSGSSGAVRARRYRAAQRQPDDNDVHDVRISHTSPRESDVQRQTPVQPATKAALRPEPVIRRDSSSPDNTSSVPRPTRNCPLSTRMRAQFQDLSGLPSRPHVEKH